MLELFKAEFKRMWIEFIRYPIEAISAVITTSFIFYGLFITARYVAGPSIQFSERLDAIVVGYLLWTLVIFILQGIAFGLQVEAQTGTLEQVFLSPFGALRVLLIRSMANLIFSLALMGGVLLLTMVLTGRYLHLPASLFLPLITIVLAAYGISFMLGALTLLFKRVQQLSGLVQFGLLFLLTLPTETWKGQLQGLRLLLPMTLGSGVLRDLIAFNQSLDWFKLSLALLNGVGYFVLGVLVFHWVECKAKRQANLGGY